MIKYIKDNTINENFGSFVFEEINNDDIIGNFKKFKNIIGSVDKRYSTIMLNRFFKLNVDTYTLIFIQLPSENKEMSGFLKKVDEYRGKNIYAFHRPIKNKTIGIKFEESTDIYEQAIFEYNVKRSKVKSSNVKFNIPSDKLVSEIFGKEVEYTLSKI